VSQLEVLDNFITSHNHTHTHSSIEDPCLCNPDYIYSRDPLILSATIPQLLYDADLSFLKKGERAAALDPPVLGRVYASTLEFWVNSSDRTKTTPYVVTVQLVDFFPEIKSGTFKETLQDRLTNGNIKISCNCPAELYWGYCFTADTKIPTSNGMKEISNISIGDFVYGEDRKLHRVVNVAKRQTQRLITVRVDGEYFSCTVDHPWLVSMVKPRDGEKNIIRDDFNYVSVGSLDPKNTFVGVKSILSETYASFKDLPNYRQMENITEAFYAFPVHVYDLEVERVHSFCVGEARLVVHNSYLSTEMDYVYPGFEEGRFPEIRNPGLRGTQCKHGHRVLEWLADPANLDKIAQAFTAYSVLMEETAGEEFTGGEAAPLFGVEPITAAPPPPPIPEIPPESVEVAPPSTETEETEEVTDEGEGEAPSVPTEAAATPAAEPVTKPAGKPGLLRRALAWVKKHFKKVPVDVDVTPRDDIDPWF
jgi:hypothetical protein